MIITISKLYKPKLNLRDFQFQSFQREKNSILESRKRILTTRIISKGKHEARANSWWRLVVPTGDRESLISAMTFPWRGIERVTSLNCPLETFEWLPRLNAFIFRERFGLPWKIKEARKKVLLYLLASLSTDSVPVSRKVSITRDRNGKRGRSTRYLYIYTHIAW